MAAGQELLSIYRDLLRSDPPGKQIGRLHTLPLMVCTRATAYSSSNQDLVWHVRLIREICGLKVRRDFAAVFTVAEETLNVRTASDTLAPSKLRGQERLVCGG